MKTIYLILLCTFSFASAQVETEWETLVNGNNGLTLYYRFVADDGHKQMEIKFLKFKGLNALPFTVSEGKKFNFILNNGQTIELQNDRFTTSCIGCGSVGLIGSNALGAKTYYPLDDEQIQILMTSDISGFKLYTDDDSYDMTMRPKKSNELKEWLSQIQ